MKMQVMGLLLLAMCCLSAGLLGYACFASQDKTNVSQHTPERDKDDNDAVS
jgi:amino acid permease